MRNIYLFFTALITLFYITSCGEKETNVDDLIAVGGKKYGGELHFMSSDKVSTLFPLFSADLYSNRIISQLFEPLLKTDPKTLETIPAVAESYVVDKSAKVYTFKIRKGIKFHADPCFGKEPDELTAEDVEFSLRLACSGIKENKISYLLIPRIKGANEFYRKSMKSVPDGEKVSGIKIINPYTIQIELNEPFIGFEKLLTHYGLGIISKKAYEKYGVKSSQHPVGSGPFALESISSEKIVLKRNNHYWMRDDFGNQLPFLKKVVVTFAKDKKSELLAFRKAEIDLVLEIPVEEVPNILGTLAEAQEGKNVKHKVESKKSVSMQFIGMNCKSKEFSNEDVRKAFNLAIDRVSIADVTLEGEGWPAINGFVPEMGGYDSKYIKGHSYDPDMARKLMAEAGYPGGKNFPELDFYVNASPGSSTDLMCKEIARQIYKNIGVKLTIRLCSFQERQEAVASGKAKIWRAAWIADYPDPETFLSMFYGKYMQNNNWNPNSFGFNDSGYNSLIDQILKEAKPDKRTELMMKADQILIDKAAVMPILISDHIVMTNVRVRNFEASPLEHLDLTSVYIKEVKL